MSFLDKFLVTVLVLFAIAVLILVTCQPVDPVFTFNKVEESK